MDPASLLLERAEGLVAAGVMTGTSMDAIDCAVIRIENGTISVLSTAELPFRDGLRNLLLSLVSGGPISISDVTRAHYALAEDYARAVSLAIEEAKKRWGPESIRDIAVLGCHGQTVSHATGAGGTDNASRGDDLGPVRGTLQLLSGPTVAFLTGLPTVTDFRAADIAAGGTGAPLMPFAEDVISHALARAAEIETERNDDAKNNNNNKINNNAQNHADGSRKARETNGFRGASSSSSAPSPRPMWYISQNIGGIGNVAFSGGGTVRGAFDTGPGNLVIDGVAHARLGVRMDESGKSASMGKVDGSLLAWSLSSSERFLALEPPRSAGHEEFGQRFVAAFVERGAGMDTPDLLATAAEFTAVTIRDAIVRHVLPAMERARAETGGGPERFAVDVTGGGARNDHLVSRLRALLSAHADVRTFLDVPKEGDGDGICPTHRIPSDAREAVGFAILGLAHVCGVPANIPEATGASARVLLGSLSPPPKKS